MTAFDDALIQLGRERLRASAPALNDQQWLTWLASVWARGSRLELLPDGVRAVFDRQERSA